MAGYTYSFITTGRNDSFVIIGHNDYSIINGHNDSFLITDHNDFSTTGQTNTPDVNSVQQRPFFFCAGISVPPFVFWEDIRPGLVANLHISCANRG